MHIKNNSGISLITMVITVVVLIILTTISFRKTSNVPDEANYTKYMQVMKNVQIGVENAKLKNAADGTTEEKLNAGFKKVYLENVPESFVSFGENDKPISGYLVDLEKINYTNAEYGKAYDKYSEDDTLIFGEKEFDVYVYDAEWTVYYIKGLKYNESMNYKLD